VRPDERLLVLLSGGASAMMALPAEGLTLADKIAVTSALLKGGAGIHQLNVVRKHLSGIKGGQLASASNSPVLTLAISDVIGDDLSAIGSGPTVPDDSTFRDALRVIEEARPQPPEWPTAVLQRLHAGVAGRIAETPKPGEPRLAGHQARVIGSRREAMAGAAAEAERLGYRSIVLDDPVAGEARLAGPALFARASNVARRADVPLCIVTSGETTVHVTGDGLGGRNQELVLSSLGLVAGHHGGVAFASAGTDGVDGPTRAAGALADATSLERAQALGLSPDDFLRRNDAFHFFEAMGDLIRTGPTGTNVGDLQVFLAPPRLPGHPGGASV